MIGAVVGLLATMTMSPFGLYHHVVATDVNRDATTGFALVTVRGDNSTITPGLKDLLDNRGNAKVYLYRRGTAVSDDDVTTLQRDHPDWLARDAAGKIVTSNAGGDVIDITKAPVRNWLVDGLQRDVKTGAYDGVYLDVLGSFFSQRFYSGRPVIDGLPLADAAWRDASVALIGQVKQATGKPVIANGFGLQGGKNYLDHQADSDKLIAAADGIQIEQFVRNGNLALDKYENAARWRDDVALLQSAGRLGKTVLADTRVRQSGDAAAVARQRTYALASFLVGAEGDARFRFAEGAGTGTVDASMADTINALGAPLEDARTVGSTMVRRFTGGSVRVDPVTHVADISGVSSSASAMPDTSHRSSRARVLVIAAAAALAVFLVGLALLARRRDD